MENTGSVRFENDSAQWYLALGERWVGPLTATDIYEKILKQELTWAHYVWKQGQAEWKRLCDVKTFQAALPQPPARTVQTEVKEAAKPAAKSSSRAKPPAAPPGARKEWYLFYNDSQYGPFSHDEVDRYLRVGKIHGRVHAWRDGMDGWERIEKIGLFHVPLDAPARTKGKQKDPSHSLEIEGVEQRNSPRRPLVAKLLVANQESVITGVCRDISVGGMQVLTEKVPGPVGTRLKMNVSPSGMEPFVAEGLVVRILEDGRGFSFRFERLGENAKRAIESYIQVSG
ncbi:MAG: GYF domain-containing protein [Bdellovibrionota bacterium]